MLEITKNIIVARVVLERTDVIRIENGNVRTLVKSDAMNNSEGSCATSSVGVGVCPIFSSMCASFHSLCV